MASQAQMFDRREWINGIRSRVKTQKLVRVTLRPNGVTAGELAKALGPAFGVQPSEGNQVMIALKQRTPVAA